MTETISTASLIELLKPSIGKTISHAWEGYGSAIFIEVGQLSKDEKQNNPTGEFTFMIEGSWRVEKENIILFGSWSEPETISKYWHELIGPNVKEVVVVGQIPELCISLSSEFRILSFSTTHGDPEWAILLPDNTEIYSRFGKVIKENRQFN